MLLLPDWVPTSLELSGPQRFYLFAGILMAVVLILLIAGILRQRGVM